MGWNNATPPVCETCPVGYYAKDNVCKSCGYGTSTKAAGYYFNTSGFLSPCDGARPCRRPYIQPRREWLGCACERGGGTGPATGANLCLHECATHASGPNRKPRTPRPPLSIFAKCATVCLPGWGNFTFRGLTEPNYKW